MTRSKRGNKKTTEENKELLITPYKSDIIKKVKDNRVVIIVGQTGCGKSTQVPQYLHDSRESIGLGIDSKIACLHPRSVAAMKLAERVAEESKNKLGETIGYRVRFYRLYNEKFSRILFMTAGYMLRLLTVPTIIEDYSVVIVDEVHERSVDNDLIIGQMHILMKSYKKLRLVIMSATMNVQVISGYFPDAAIVKIASVKQKINVIYRPVNGNDYVAAVCHLVLDILTKSNKGHILVFLPSEDKIWQCKKSLKVSKAIVLPFYGAMDHFDKMKVFQEYKGRQKVVLATNIAETSLTIDNVKFVVDAGFVKRIKYDHDLRVERWITERVSVAEAEQRKGRTGRTGDGKGVCYRLYEPYSYEDKLLPHLQPFISDLKSTYSVSQLHFVAEKFDDIVDRSSFEIVCDQINEVLKLQPPSKTELVSRHYPIPEICMANLEPTVLSMKANKIDIKTFPFIVPPDPNKIRAAASHLRLLSLFEDDGSITPLGQKVARLPLNPSYGKVAVLASSRQCRVDVFIILSLLSSSQVFKRPSKNSRSLHKIFHHQDGDLLMLLNVFYEAEMNQFDKRWCVDNGLICASVKYAKLILSQLWHLLPWDSRSESLRSIYPTDEIKQAFLCGFFENLSVIDKNKHKMMDEKMGIVYQFSCVDKTQKYLMPLTNQSSLSSTQVIMKHCTVYDRDLLLSINPKSWRIRVDIWNHIMQFLGTRTQ